MKLHRSSFILHPSVPHVLAWVLACTTFPLIWMGGFVTTYRAGMAVPDWPTTYGYNMFLYPLESWLKVWDVLLEHSHRLIASGAGIVTILLAVALWLGDRRRWLAWLGLAAVVAVSLQGVLGGLRVIADERFLAKVHGCTAPLFFALTTSLVALTSPKWRAHVDASLRDAKPAASSPPIGFRASRRLAPLVAVAAYLQIVAGAQLRHLTPQERVYWFAVWVAVHLVLGCIVAAGTIWLALFARRRLRSLPALDVRARLLFWAMLLQLSLGVTTWVTNYGWPAWFTDYVWPLRYTVVAGGAWQAVATTAHVAVGALVLAMAVSLALWSWRLSDIAGLCEEPEAVWHCLTAAGERFPPRIRSSPAAVKQWHSPTTRQGSLRDWWRLTRPGIVGMVLVTMSVAAMVAPDPPAWTALANSLVGAALVIVGAIALNQQFERGTDARMARTAGRPLPSGQLSTRQVVWFSVVTTAVGLGYLAFSAPPTVAFLAAVSWVLYVWMYTPLKRRSAWQTPLGAVAGAMPILMGAAVARGWPNGVMPVVLFAVVYFWQFPHTMAVAWLYRDELAAANLKVATVVDPSGRVAGRLSLAGAAALVPLSLLPCLAGSIGWGYAAIATLLSLGYLAPAVWFWLRADDASARALLRASLVYLPAICAALLCAARWHPS